MSQICMKQFFWINDQRLRGDTGKDPEDLELEEKGYLINVNKGYWRLNNELLKTEQLYYEFYSVVSQKGYKGIY